MTDLIDLIEPGYVGYLKTPGAMGKLIRIGEGLYGKSEVNHMVIFGDHGKVIQAEMKGVTYDATYEDTLAKASAIFVVRPPLFVDLRRVVEFGEFYVGTEYGLGTDIGIGFDMMSGYMVPSVRGVRRDSIICSALGSEALRYGGWLHHWPDIYYVTPQQSKDAILADGGVVL